jgi:TonB-linked SusC/RagA family outer membrane protein
MKHLLLAMATGLCMSVSVLANHANANIPSNKFFQSTTITGKVTNEKGEPLGNVTVQAKGKTRVTVLTASDGSFSITVPAGTTELIFSYVGSEIQEVAIAGKTTLDIQLKPEDNTLGDVVVVGYGTQKKINLTGAVASVSGKLLTQRPAPNSANLLEGRVTGLQVIQPSSEPGRDAPSLLLRGRTTFQSSTAPLVLIDGVTGNINNVAPNDIENITVLKDAASAAIYGARAANGVVLITTKKGKKGAPVISYNVNVSRYSPTAMPDFVTNSAEYMEMYNAAATRAGVAFKYDPAEIAKYKNAADRNLYPNFDAVDYYFKPALVTNHNLSVSGGNDKSAYNLSVNYLNQEAMLPVYNFKKYNALFNYSNQLSNAVSIGTVMNITYKNRQEPPFTSENMALLVYAAGPLITPFLPDGSGRIISKAYVNEGKNRNAQEALAMGWQNTKEYNINAQAYMDVKLLKGFTWSSKLAINYTDEYYKMYQHPYNSYYSQVRDPAANNDYLFYNLGPDQLGVTDQYSKTISPTIYTTFTYDKKIADDHNIKLLAGYEQLSNKFQTLRAKRINTVSTALTELAGYSPTGELVLNSFVRLPGLSAPFEWALQSYFGRINYDYKGKYLLEANARYDGTSRVSPEYRWGFFPSVSLGWLASKEDFIRDNASWISNLKLRASYGTLGNQDIGNYPFQDVLALNVNYPFDNNALTQGAVLSAFRDRSIQWESTRTSDIGLDLDIFKGMFGVTFDWFRRNSFDIIATPLLPSSLGLSVQPINNAKMHSQGFELELRHENVIGKVNYGLNFALSSAKNKVDQIYVPSLTAGNIRQVGYAYEAHYLYEWNGIFQEEDITDPKTPKHTLNPSPKAGDLKMKDQNGDGIIDTKDLVVFDGAYPDFIYSFGGHAGYKGFELNFFFQGVEGTKNRVNNWGVDPFMQGTPPTTKWRDAWTPQNRSNTLPGIYTAGYTGVSAYNNSTYFLMDASYLRLKNVMLSYTFPKTIFSRIKAQGLTVYVSAENLLTFTNYEGSDPERSGTTGNYVQYPQARVLNAGLNIKF